MRGPHLLIALLMGAAAVSAAEVSFSTQIQPILEERCWKCHGASVQLGKLDLRTKESSAGVIVAGKAESSSLYRHVAGLQKPLMPMDGKLTPEQIALIKDWIDEGAVWDAAPSTATSPTAQLSGLEDMKISPEARNYWAFRLPQRNAPPGPGNPIDAFLEEAWRKQGLKPAPEADRVTLLRRAYLDLIGLPPSPAEAAEFLNDTRPDAWDRLIDRLLDSPHYGERWGRHWLDVARYADSNGYEHDFDRPNAWRYRDYVIRSFNADKPFDVFLREQLAGDELPHVTNETLIATAFLRNYAKVGFREKDNPEFRYEYLDDMIATIGRGILGLTVQCARCHNHKFDPIPQKDYYRMQAVLWPVVEVDHPLVARDEAVEYERKLAAVNEKVGGLRSRLRDLEQPYRDRLLAQKYKTYPQNIQDAIATPEEQRTPGQKLLAAQIILTVSVSSDAIDRVMNASDLETKRKLQAEIAAAENERPAPIPTAMGVTDGDYRFTPDGPGDEPAPGKGVKKAAIEGSYVHTGAGHYQPPPSYFLIRGDVNSRGSLMQPGFITVATYGNPPAEIPPPTPHTSGRRLALAEWLTSAENPLTARVAVNRIWHHHFGRGLVASLDNFGKMGEAPTNQELLDWLAIEFRESGWSFKKMHRLIMTSRAYRMDSGFTDPVDAAKDPDNRLLWRYRLHRLDAESVRDAILAVSGGLNGEMFGPPVFPVLDKDTRDSMLNGIWKQDGDGPKVWRRSIYVYRKRGLPFPMFEAFDLPDQNLTCGARNVSTVPTQALMLLNDGFVLKQAKLFAGRIREAAPDDAAQQIETAYRVALSRAPSDAEREMARSFVDAHDLTGFAHVLLNLNEFMYVR
ncbi:MAG: DUF1553 domain-containing protein [Acidobacteriaceae bacterium]|nr:DUF1553 domain-containing protein [Acidobacteriaceae bacterium]